MTRASGVPRHPPRRVRFDPRRYVMKTLQVSAVMALLAAVLGAPTAGAETVRCQRAIAKASAQFLQSKAKALSACEQRLVASGSGACPDATATAALAKA